MRFKADENIPNDVVECLRAAGHDASSVPEQAMSGTTDDQVAEVCRDEQRVIVTLDLDFSDIRRFAPVDYPGIIILRPAVQTVPHLVRIVTNLLPLISTEPLAGKLWIVDENRVRIRPE